MTITFGSSSSDARSTWTDLKSVPLAQAMRQDRLDLEPAGPEDRRQERRGGDPVDIVVADRPTTFSPALAGRLESARRLPAMTGEPSKGSLQLVGPEAEP